MSKESLEFDRLVSEASRKIHNHTIQFLAKGGKYGHKPYGSGVLLFTNNKCIILTASHVVNDFDNTPLFVTSIKGIIPIAGILRETDLDKDKNVDVAYIILDDVIASILVQTYYFIPIGKILISHKAEDSNLYLVVGYPTRNIRTEDDERKVYAGSATYLVTNSNEKVYQYYNLDLRIHYSVIFSGKGTGLDSQEQNKIGDPYGMSGCGLWFISRIPNQDEIVLDYHLIGIMTSFRKGKYHCLIGNRIETIINALKNLESFDI